MWAYPLVLTGMDQDEVKKLSKWTTEFEASGYGDAEDAGGA
jgi:hypothetical protein